MLVCPACAKSLTGTDLSGGWACPACGNEPHRSEGVVLLDDSADDGGFDGRSFAHLAEAEPRSFWFRGRNDLLVETVQGLSPQPSRLLEIGCGTGYVLRALDRALPGCEVAGAEVFAEGLAFAHERMPGVPLLQLDARDLPFDSHFDAVGAFDVLEHIDRDEHTLRSIHRALVPGGHVVITVPQHPWLWSDADTYAHHERRYTRRELRTKLRAAGFEIERLTSFVTLLLPLMLVSRVAERFRRGEYDPVREFRATERSGGPLEATLRLERWLIRRGVSLPAGGSLVAVARRPG